MARAATAGPKQESATSGLTSKTRIKNSIPIPPGEILIEEFMRHFGFSQNRRARDLDVPVTRINVDRRHVLKPIGGLAAVPLLTHKHR